MLDKSSKIVNFNIGRILSLFSTKQVWKHVGKRSYTKQHFFFRWGRRRRWIKPPKPKGCDTPNRTFCSESCCSTIWVFPELEFDSTGPDDFLSVSNVLAVAGTRSWAEWAVLFFRTSAKGAQQLCDQKTQTQLLQSVCQILGLVYNVIGCFFFSDGAAFGLLDGRFVTLPTVKKLVFVKETKVVGEKCFCSGNTEIYNFGWFVRSLTS